MIAPGPRELSPSQSLIVSFMHAYASEERAMVWSGGLVELMAAFGVSEPAARMALTRLARRGVISRAKQGRFVHYLLDEDFKRTLAAEDERIAFLLEREREPETWTLVWSDGADNRPERTMLTLRLRRLGFAPLQGSIWIAPHDRSDQLAELVRHLGMQSTTTILVGAGAQGFGPRSDRVWDVAEIGDRYERFCTTYGPWTDGTQVAASDLEAFKVHVMASSAFRAAAAADPGLPGPAVQSGRRRASAIVKAVHSALGPGAQRHFDAVTTAWLEDGLLARSADAR